MQSGGCKLVQCTHQEFTEYKKLADRPAKNLRRCSISTCCMWLEEKTHFKKCVYALDVVCSL